MVIEAIGIRTYYSIVSEALTDSLLVWRGIEATVELSNTTNSKIVVVGGNKDQMLLIPLSDIGQQSSVPQPVPSIDPDADPLPDWSTLKDLFPGVDVSGPLLTDDSNRSDDYSDQSPEDSKFERPGQRPQGEIEGG